MRIESAAPPLYAMELPDPTAEPAPAQAPESIGSDSAGQRSPPQKQGSGRRSRLASLLAEHGLEVEESAEKSPAAPPSPPIPIINFHFDSLTSLALRRMYRRLNEERKLRGRLHYATEVRNENLGLYLDRVA